MDFAAVRRLPEPSRKRLAELASAKLARESLTDFCCYTDPTQAHNYQAHHLQRIALALERVERGECKRLFITCPPRHWKSSLGSEKFPQWFLGRNPAKSVGLVSNAANLATGFSRNVRDTIMGNPRYRNVFSCQVNQSSSAINEWSLLGTYRTSFRAFGVESSITGAGFDLVVIDDPVADNQAAFSKTKRDSSWEWYKQTLRDRLEPGGAIVLIMSRWHQSDLAGMILQASKTGDGEPWEVLTMPAIDNGRALWPERWPLEELARIKRGVGSRAWAARFMGDPKPDDGNLLNSAKLVMVDPENVPPMVRTVRRWDLAFSDRDGSDWLSGAKLGIDEREHVYILHVRRVHGRWPQGKPVIIETAQADGIDCTVYIESNGTQLGYADDIKSDSRMRNRTVLEDRPEGNKEMRASIWGTRLVDGIIHCVRGEWNGELFDQMDYFPSAEHDDDVDAISGAYAKLTDVQRIFVA